MLQPLQSRAFRWIWIGQTISMTGTRMYRVALPIQAFALGASAADLGTIFASYAGAQLLAATIAGTLVDRYSSRRVAIVADVCSAAAAAAAAALSASGSLQLGHLIFQAIVFGGCSALVVPAVASLIPVQLDPALLVRANGLRALGIQGSGIIGALAGGFIVFLLGPAAAFAIDSLSFALSAIALWWGIATADIQAQGQSLLAGVRTGAMYVLAHAWLWRTTASFALISALQAAAFAVAIPVLLQTDARALGAVQAALVAGQGAATLVLVVMPMPARAEAWYAATALTGVSLIAMGFQTDLPTLIVGAACCGIGLGIATPLWLAALQTHIPAQLRGRVIGLNQFGEGLLTPVVPLFVAGLAERSGVSISLITVGALVAGMCAVVLIDPGVRQLT